MHLLKEQLIAEAEKVFEDNPERKRIVDFVRSALNEVVTDGQKTIDQHQRALKRYDKRLVK